MDPLATKSHQEPAGGGADGHTARAHWHTPVGSGEATLGICVPTSPAHSPRSEAEDGAGEGLAGDTSITQATKVFSKMNVLITFFHYTDRQVRLSDLPAHRHRKQKGQKWKKNSWSV